MFDEAGKLRPELAALAPHAIRRMSANPHASRGLLLENLNLPDYHRYAVAVPELRAVDGEATSPGQFLRDVIAGNPHNFRVFSPDETISNRWGALFEETDRCSTARILPSDDHVAPDGRVMEMLSEHQCEGWLEGYLLTGRHGFFSCYEAFIHIVDSMFNQHAKWLKVANGIPWRRPIASLNYLLSSHVWRQDHNGFSHQDHNHDNIHVHGYREEGTTTTPFDMTVLNAMDRLHLAMAAVDRLPQTGENGVLLKHNAVKGSYLLLLF